MKILDLGHNLVADGEDKEDINIGGRDRLSREALIHDWCGRIEPNYAMRGTLPKSHLPDRRTKTLTLS
jgi:hypothetical protein